MKVLVTGADGMLGSHICRELLARNYQVRALVQQGRTADTIDDLKLERYLGDILNFQDLKRSLSGCDVVIHTAASTQIWPPRSPMIWKINYEGTVKVAKAVLELDLEKFIHIGTANSFGPGSKADPGDEDTDYADFIYNLDYQDSKHAAQVYLLNLVKTDNLPVCIINPSFMFGAYDSKPGSGAMIISIYQGKLIGYTSGGRSYIAAKDVATCAVNALTRGKIGECYLAAGANLNYQEVFELIAKTIGVHPPKLPIPMRRG